MNLKHVSAFAAALTLAASPAVASAADVNTLGLRKAVKPANVFQHQGDLEAIADANNGNRDTRTSGYQDSVDYVVDQLESYGYDPQIVQFNLPEWVENSTPVLTRTESTRTSPTCRDGRGRRQPGGGLHHLRAVALREPDQCPGRAHQRHPDSEPGRLDEWLRAEDYPARLTARSR